MLSVNAVLEVFCIFDRIKKQQILFLRCLKNHNFLGQGLLNSINKLPVYKFPSVKTFRFPFVAKFFNSFGTDTFSVCHISFRFSDSVSLAFLN